MKVVAFNGSPRTNGNTEILINTVFKELQSEGIDTEMVHIGGNLVRGCTGCCACRDQKLGRCIFDDDPMNGWIEKMKSADGIIIGSPTYFADITTEVKALIDRSGYVLRPDRIMKRKLGAAIVMQRRGGAIHAFDSINHFFTINEMITVGASYWSMAVGGPKGDVEKDDEGLNTMKNLGQNMAWLLKKVCD